MSNKTIVLCLDVDDTLINYDHGILSFNGSAALWSDFLSRFRYDCNRAGCKLIIQIISAKQSGNVDATIQNIVKSLHHFLPARTRSGSRYESSAHEYYAMFHVDGFHIKKKIRCDQLYDCINHYRSIPGQSVVIPAIHICCRNVHGHTSKAKVMRQISEFFNVPAANMFLLDNDEGNRRDLETGAKGLTPRYTFISAQELWRLRKPADKNERDQACHQLLGVVQVILKQRIDDILAEEAVRSYLNTLVESVVETYCDIEKAPLDQPTNMPADKLSFFQPIQHSINVKHMTLHGAQPFICDAERVTEINHRISFKQFEQYLDFFHLKAQRKTARAGAGTAPTLQSAAEAAEQFHRRLLEAQITLFKSEDPIDSAQHVFVETCLAAIRDADKVLLTRGKWLLYGVNSKQSYVYQRNALLGFLAPLKISHSVESNGQFNQL